MDIANKLEDFDNHRLSELVINMFHQIMVHHTIYFLEVEHQFGMPAALEIMEKAFPKSYKAQMKRLGKTLGIELEDAIPKVLLDMPQEQLLALIKALGANWLAGDGIWFQSIEQQYSVLDAQRCAGGAVGKFCTFEANSIKKFLGLPDLAGLEGLKQALKFRLYHQVNVQSIIDESPNSIVFYMNECIVQTTRKRKGLDDYPCKSTGVMEYRSFAAAIDHRIVTECVGCPPDCHPEEWYCAWRFSIPTHE
ncbi:hypothetical protein ASZ90_019927 [hydrocarbon metagenome]|uniref:Cytosolic protein n=1 Tax=hydrocarbon metagenome TaxID=938273 RepID=A0A0W8E257_9ZZZZ